MRFLFIESLYKEEDIMLWLLPSFVNDHDTTMEELLKLRLIKRVVSLTDSKEDTFIEFNDHYRKSLQRALCHNMVPWGNLPATSSSNIEVIDSKGLVKTGPTAEELESYSSDRWNALLHFLVRGEHDGNLPATAINFLVGAGLMQEISSSGGRERNKVSGGIAAGLCITAKGYEYMLRDTQSQIWVFASECLKRAERFQEEVMLFLFTLSYCEVGTGYSTANLTRIQQQLVMEFSHLGVIYLQGGGSKTFYPTALAVNILFGQGPQATDGRAALTSGPRPVAVMDQLRVIVQTNFQVVAYLTSALHLAMISLFVDVRMRLPNMALGTITRASAKEAFRMGISAAQIAHFLATHAPERLQNRQLVVPENVNDQLYIWENEKNKVVAESATMVDLAEVLAGDKLALAFESLIGFCLREKLLLWSDSEKGRFALRSEGYPALVSFAQNQGLLAWW